MAVRLVTVELQAAATSAGLVSLLCLAIAAASWRAVLRTGNGRIGWVVAAFIVLALKNGLKAARLASGALDSPPLELAFSLADLLAVVLIAWPLLSRGWKPSV